MELLQFYTKPFLKSNCHPVGSEFRANLFSTLSLSAKLILTHRVVFFESFRVVLKLSAKLASGDCAKQKLSQVVLLILEIDWKQAFAIFWIWNNLPLLLSRFETNLPLLFSRFETNLFLLFSGFETTLPLSLSGFEKPYLYCFLELKQTCCKFINV